MASFSDTSSRVVYKLAYEHLQFWRNNKVFSERSIARMEEAELVSELLIAALAGPQDKKKSIDSFYSKYDDSFPEKEAYIERFRNVMQEIESAQAVADTEFHRAPLFYTLFCAVYHRRYGIPTIDLKRPAKADAPLSESERAKLQQATHYLSDVLLSAKEDGPIEEQLQPFVVASGLQTDNIKPRVNRLMTVYQRAFG